MIIAQSAASFSMRRCTPLKAATLPGGMLATAATALPPGAPSPAGGMPGMAAPPLGGAMIPAITLSASAYNTHPA